MKTGLFELTMLVKPVEYKTIERDRLFFDQYHYSLCFILPDCGVLRETSEAKLLKLIDWRNQSRRSWGRNDQISDVATANLLAMWHLLDQHKDQIKFTCSFNRVYLYSNNAALLESVANQPYTRVKYGQHAVVVLPRDVVLKKNPQFKLRSYFKDCNMEQHQQELLRNFLVSRRDIYGFTSSFRLHLARPRWFFVQRHQWIEHNDPADITMVSLVVPGLFRKTVPVQAK